MRSESLEYFLEIAECGSFTQASKKLFVSQQGLSKSIKALEKDLGCRLFQRDGSQLKLSAAGRALVPHARQCLGDVHAIREAMAPFGHMAAPGRAPGRDRITLFATAFIADSLFSLLDDDIRKAGLANVRIIERTPDEIAAALQDEECPSLFAACMPVEDVPRISGIRHVEFHPLFVTEIMLVGSSQFVHPEKGAFSLDRIARMPVVYYNDPTLNHIIEEMFCGRALENVITHAASTSRISRYIHQGKAVTFSDSLSCYLTDEDDELAYAPIEGAARFVVGFAYASGTQAAAGHREYVEAFDECFRIRCAPYLEVYPTPTI